MIDEVIQKLQEHDKRFDHVDGQIDFLVKKVLEHDEQLQWFRENIATKKDLRDISGALDKLVGLEQKKDQELTFMGNRVSRVEEQTEQNTNDIKKMKPALGLS